MVLLQKRGPSPPGPANSLSFLCNEMWRRIITHRSELQAGKKEEKGNKWETVTRGESQRIKIKKAKRRESCLTLSKKNPTTLLAQKLLKLLTVPYS